MVIFWVKNHSVRQDWILGVVLVGIDHCDLMGVVLGVPCLEQEAGRH